MVEFIATIFLIILFSIMSVFQALLAIGLPFGHLAYGGKYKKLPTNLRIMSVVAIGIFIFGIIAVLERVELINIFNNPVVSLVTVWILAGYSTLNVLMNIMSRNKWEKRIMTPVAITIATCCYLVAIFT
ncbi:MAG: hypothetical protein ACFE8B_17530 [Candidatus Hermodarchaeota archaeon]